MGKTIAGQVYSEEAKRMPCQIAGESNQERVMSIFRTRREVDELEDDVVALKKRVAELEAKPDASAGLIEAAEWHKQQVVEYDELARKVNPERGSEYRVKADAHWRSAKELRSRAADRSGK